MSAISTSGQVPASLLRACEKHVDKIEQIGAEGENGYWIYLRDGWWKEEAQTVAIVEHTVRDCIRALRWIKPDPRAPNER